jgi:RNA polymerase sigma factor (sigma-70 family)
VKEKKLENYITNKSINLDRIVDDYTPYLRKIIQNMVGNNLTEEDKEEIISDAFFILWKKYKENIKINYLDSYLAGITRNLIKEKLKTLKYNIDIEQCKNLIEYSNLETYLQEREEINELYNKISNLKEIDIKIIKMFYYSNKLIKDIAKELKISEVNVKTRLHRIRKKIKKELRKGGV